MPVTAVEDTPGIVVLVADGDLSFQEMMEILASYRTGDRLSSPFICDISKATISLSAAQVQQLAAKRSEISKSNAIGPVAFVTSDDLAFALGRMYAAYSELGGRKSVGVFRTREAAREWLTHR